MIREKDIIKGLKQLRTTVKPDPKWIEESRANLLAYFKENFPYQKENFVFYLKPVLVSLVVLFVIISGVAGLLNETKRSLPGSQLYSLKRAYEEITFRFVSKEERSLARTEMAQKRLEEVKTLVQKVEFKDSEVPLSVKKATRELKKEIASLKKEIAMEKGENILNGFGDLPIRDDKKIIEVIAQKDLEKLLIETKEAIKDKNLVMALEKIGEAEEIFSETPVEEESSSTESKITEPEIKEEVKPETITPKINPAKSDFKIDLEKEESDFKTDLIKQ